MNPLPLRTRAGSLAALAALAVTPALGNGFRVSSQDAFASGRGEAFAATADNPSAIYYNPAGIGQLKGHDLRGGVYGLYLDVQHQPTGGGNSSKNSEDLQAIPQLYYTYGPEKLPLTFGLGLYSPYGLSSEWPQDSGFRTVATQGKLTYMTINPVVSFKLRENLFIGGGPTINFANLDLQQGLTPIPNNDLFKFKGDGSAVGFNLGLLWQPHQKVSLGLNYRSASQMDFDGTTTTAVYSPVLGVMPVIPPSFSLQQNASTKMSFPQNVVCGVSYRPTPDWNFEFNADYTDWNTMNQLTVNQATPVPPIPLYWQSSWYYEAGVTRKLGQQWRVSAGYIYNQNSVPDAYYSPLVSDLNRQFVTAGVGYSGKHFNADLAYQFGFSAGRTVAGSWAGTSNQGMADGHYKFRSQALLLSLGWKF
jgi:long-chain fatty acid transport protein